MELEIKLKISERGFSAELLRDGNDVYSVEYEYKNDSTRQGAYPVDSHGGIKDEIIDKHFDGILDHCNELMYHVDDIDKQGICNI